MEEGTAILIAKCKMQELGIEDYLLRYRHLKLDDNETLEIRSEHHLYILVTPKHFIKVESKTGIYDTQDEGLNELQYVHRGIIKVINRYPRQIDVRFLQVIPKRKT